MDRNDEKKTVGESPRRQARGFDFFAALKLVLCAVALYVGLNHLDVLFEGVGWMYGILEPLLIGALLALVLNTPMCALEKLMLKIACKLKAKPKERLVEIIALVLTFVLAFLVIYIVGDTVIPQLGESVTSMFQTFQQQMPAVMKLLAELEDQGFNTAPLENLLRDIDINDIIKKISDNAVNIFNTLLSSVNTVLSSVTTIITGLFMAVSAIVFAIYILANKRKLSVQARKLAYAYIKKSTVDHAADIFSMSTKTFSDFISGQCLDAFILGMLMFISMSIFGFPYPLAISVLIMVTALIPYVGAFLGGAFGMLLILLNNPLDPLRSVLFLLLFIVVQQIDNHLIYPRVVGGSVGLPAIWTFAAVIIGGGMFGVIGMLLFIPIFSVLYTILRANVNRRLGERNIVLDSGEQCEGEEKRGIDFMSFEFMKKWKSRFSRIAGTDDAEGSETEEGEADAVDSEDTDSE